MGVGGPDESFPAAASRLKVFVVLPGIKIMHDTLEGYFRKSPLIWRLGPTGVSVLTE